MIGPHRRSTPQTRQIATLTEARAIWERHFSGPFPWDERYANGSGAR
jgi:hypothetical protein